MLSRKCLRIWPLLAVTLLATSCGQGDSSGSASLTAQMTIGRLAAAADSAATKSYQSGQYKFYAPEQHQQPGISADEARSIFERVGAIPSVRDAKSVEAQFADFVNTTEALPSQAIDGAGPTGSAPVWQLVYHDVPMPYHGPAGSTRAGTTYTTDLIVAVATRNRQFLVAFTGAPDLG